MATCKWCGGEFDKDHNRQIYCNKNCSKEGEREKRRIRDRKYYHKYKNIRPEKQKYGLGSGYLGIHRHEDFNKELSMIKNEFKRLNIKS